MFRTGIFLTNGTPFVARALGRVTDCETVVLDGLEGIAAEVGDLDGLILQNASYTAAIAAACGRSPRLKWLQSAATEVDAFRKNGVRDGIVLTNAGDVWASCVADHAMALILGLARGLPTLERLRSAARWDRAAAGAALGGISGRTVLVVGFGNVGRAVATRARAFDMTVIALAHRATAPDPHPAHRVEPADRLDALLPQADVVVLCLPLTEETRGLFDARAIGRMKRGAVLVNVARGEILDQAALAEALSTGRLSGAGLDVATPEPLPSDDPLWSLDNVIISPHLAGFDNGPVFERLGQLCQENVTRFLANLPPLNVVAF